MSAACLSLSTLHWIADTQLNKKQNIVYTRELSGVKSKRVGEGGDIIE